MLVRKRLDISWPELARAALSAVSPADREARSAVASIEKAFGEATRAWPCLSVRSGFDATLTALSLPRGSEVLVSAITIPGMLRVLDDRGLVPVPIDVDPRTAAPSIASAESALTPRTRAVLAASLFGTRQSWNELADWSRKRGLVFFADEAQAFDGVGSYREAPADVTLLSFGPIKTCTALAGSVLSFRDAQLRDAASAVADRWSRQSDSGYAARVARFAGVHALGYGPIAEAAALLLKATGRDPDEVTASIAQSFPGSEFFDRIRRRPSGALLRTLARRLATFDEGRLAARAAAGTRLRICLGREFVVPGAAAQTMTYWTFPVLVENPDETVRALRNRGYDATARSSLVLVEPPVGRDHGEFERVRSWFDRMIFLPFDVRYSRRRLERMAGEFLRVAKPFQPAQPRETAPVQSMRISAPVAT